MNEWALQVYNREICASVSMVHEKRDEKKTRLRFKRTLWRLVMATKQQHKYIVNCKMCVLWRFMWRLNGEWKKKTIHDVYLCHRKGSSKWAKCWERREKKDNSLPFNNNTKWKFMSNRKTTPTNCYTVVQCDLLHDAAWIPSLNRNPNKIK